MAVEFGSVDHISGVISQVVAPSFMLVAVSGYLSTLHMRLSLDVERLRALNAIPAKEAITSDMMEEMARLRWRIRTLHQAVILAICSGVATALLIMAAFAVTLLNFEHLWGSAGLFIVALAFYCASMITLAAVTVHARAEVGQP